MRIAERVQRVRAGAVLRAAAIAGACAWSAGCEAPSNPKDNYIPASAIAHEAVSSTLEAWRKGGGPEPVDGGTRSVHVADTHRSEGQTLAGYKILGETAVEGGRRFVVQLTLENPPETKNARYVVVGIDPLWVFRQEDYDMISHWEHPMPAEVPPAPATEETPAAEELSAPAAEVSPAPVAETDSKDD